MRLTEKSISLVVLGVVGIVAAISLTFMFSGVTGAQSVGEEYVYPDVMPDDMYENYDEFGEYSDDGESLDEYADRYGITSDDYSDTYDETYDKDEISDDYSDDSSESSNGYESTYDEPSEPVSTVSSEPEPVNSEPACVPSTETCNNVDDDCDGDVDEGVKNACGKCGAVPSEVCDNGIDEDCNGADLPCPKPTMQQPTTTSSSTSSTASPTCGSDCQKKYDSCIQSFTCTKADSLKTRRECKTFCTENLQTCFKTCS